MTSAVIDIGTNTLLLLIVDDAQRPIVDACRFGRLGQGLDASGRLAAAAVERSLAICREYRAILDTHGAGVPIVVATQAVREAANAADFTGPAERILGAPIRVITGQREAELAFLSVARTFPALSRAPYLVVDVGGGSTEIIHAAAGRVISAVSVPIGAVRLTERHLRSDPPTAAEIAALTADLDAHLAALALPTGVTVVGTAGTATTIAAVALSLATYDSDAVTGVRISPAAVDAQLAQLLAATVAERRAVPGIEPERADVIAGGVAIYARLLARTRAPVFITADRGVRWGLVLEAQGA